MEEEKDRGLLYRRIAAKLSEEIRSGSRSPESQLPGVRDLALRFQTTAKTVTRALDDLEAKGFINRIQGRGIFVKPGGSWRSKDVRPWGCICPLGSNPVTEQLISSLEEQAGLRGQELLVRRFNRDTESVFRLVEDLAGELVRGILAVTSLSPDHILPREGLGIPSVPVLALGSFFPGKGFHGSYLVWDFNGGINSMADHLFDRGHEKIGYLGISGSLKEDPGFEIFRAAVEGRGLSFHREYCRGCADIDIDSGFRAMQSILENQDLPSALICLHDNLAVGAMKAAVQAGLTIPEDISFVGCGNTETAQAVEPALTSLSLDREMMASLALGILDLRAREGLPAGKDLQLSIPLTLIERGSTLVGDAGLNDKWL